MSAANFPRAFSKGRFRLAELVAARKVLTMTPDEQGDEQFYRDTESVAFPKLDDRQLSLLEPLAKRRVVKRGELVYKAGERDLGLTVVLRGEIEAFEQRDGTEQILATARERDFMGDVAMLQGTSALASARVTSPDAEILYVPAAELRRAFAELPGVSATIVNALIMRRRRLRRDRSLQECAFSPQATNAKDISSMIFSTKIVSRIGSLNLRANKDKRWANVCT